MTLVPKVLIVEDDPTFVQMYRTILQEEGYAAEAAGNRGEALARLDEGGWAVVLVDQRLRGADGPESGLDLLEEIGRRSPGAKSIVITAFAEPRAVERAFAAGAFDYLEKTDVLDALLRVKIRSAWDSVRSRETAAMAPSEIEAQLRETWAACRGEVDRHRKGALLESTMDLLFRTMPGFVVVDKRRRNEVEELDLVVRNESTDGFWSHEGQYILVECKHWSRAVERNEFDALRAKMRRRHGRCRLGIFVAVGGFTRGFQAVATLGSGESQDLVMPIDGEHLEQWIAATDRARFLKELHGRIVTAADAK